MNKGPWARWKSWIAVDESRPEPADAREARLDEMLRSGAAGQVGEGDGQLRWRVLGAVSARTSLAPDDRSVVGRIGWRMGALAACALVALGVGIGAVWFGPAPTPTGAPTAGITLPQGGSAPRTASPKFAAMAFLQNPLASLAARIDQPFEREAQKLVSDARNMAVFLAERVTAPIAALHQSTPALRPESPSPDGLQSGGA